MISINPEGSLTRNMLFPKVPATTLDDDSSASEDLSTKDITIKKETNTWMRLYLPNKLVSNEEKNTTKLPILFYFHLGGFILHQADTVFNNQQCARYATDVGLIVASASYRLAPENRLPAAYEDAMDALQWVKKQALDPNGDQWLRDYADFSRCFLMGCSPRACIAYQTALMAQEVDLGPIKISGLILNQPLFSSKKRTRTKILNPNDSVLPQSAFDLCWKMALPVGADKDHEYCNPLVEGKYSKYISTLPRTIVRGFEGDPLLEQKIQLVTMLIRRGVKVTAHFGEHGYHEADAIDARRHLMMIKYMIDFI